MFSYHKPCGMLTVFGFQVIDILLRLVIIVQTIVRDFLNILWAVRILFSYKFTLKMFCFGALHGAVLGKMLDVYFKDSVFKYPVAVISFYCMSRTLTYYKNYVLLDKDPLTYLTGEDAERLKRALSYIGFGERYEHLEEPKKVEFVNDWIDYQINKYAMEAVRQLNSDYNSGSDSDDEKSESDESSELECCDECGERDIDPNELGECDVNLADIGGGYAHDYCMSDEKMKEYRKAIGGEVSDDEDEETDEELEQITNDDFEEENSKSQEEDIEPIKRGWFDWRKRKEKTI